MTTSVKRERFVPSLDGSDGHTSVGVELGLVEVVDDVGDRLDRTVPSDSVSQTALRAVGTHVCACYVHLKVTSDKELAAHDCGFSCGIGVYGMDLSKERVLRCGIAWCCCNALLGVEILTGWRDSGV